MSWDNGASREIFYVLVEYAPTNLKGWLQPWRPAGVPEHRTTGDLNALCIARQNMVEAAAMNALPRADAEGIHGGWGLRKRKDWPWFVNVMRAAEADGRPVVVMPDEKGRLAAYSVASVNYPDGNEKPFTTDQFTEVLHNGARLSEPWMEAWNNTADEWGRIRGKEGMWETAAQLAVTFGAPLGPAGKTYAGTLPDGYEWKIHGGRYFAEKKADPPEVRRAKFIAALRDGEDRVRTGRIDSEAATMSLRQAITIADQEGWMTDALRKAFNKGIRQANKGALRGDVKATFAGVFGRIADAMDA